MKIPEKKSFDNVFLSNLRENLNGRGISLEQFCNLNDEIENTIIREYGAVYLASPVKVRIPSVCFFETEQEVMEFQSSTPTTSAQIADTLIELQIEAMNAYLAARSEAQSLGLDITPRGGSEAAKRSFADTVRLWNSRFEPACNYWMKKGKLTKEKVDYLKSLNIREQVKEVLDLEKKGIFFNTYFNGHILRSVAAPGTSQHLLMLALDINEYSDERIRKIMNKYGWFRTVRNDEPHFTFLGRDEGELKSLGLEKVDGDFWVPALP
ncbi:MAG: hypothetical protein D6735_15335 [Acidobacteria bacterium]|nr:MAG: hypothetical protein D6735_15335 [Acidobacteriota bacterium]